MIADPYGSRPINPRSRRKADELEELRRQLLALVTEHAPVTCRQVFYLAVSAGMIAKTENAYKNDIVRNLGILRREGRLPWGYVADNTRWIRRPESWDSVEAAIDQIAASYRRQLWNDQDAYVEVWCEKDALAGVLYEETESYNVPLLVTRGYASLSYLHGAAEAIQTVDKPAFIYYLGDHDPSGVDIQRSAETFLREHAPDVDLTFTRLAVLPEQIAFYDLTTRPTKASDTRSKGWTGGSVEVDAIPPRELRTLVAEAIASHIDFDALQLSEAVEAQEREGLRLFRDTFGRLA